MDNKTVEAFINSPLLSALDRAFASFMSRLAGGGNPELLLASAMVSLFRSRGHICLPLDRHAGVRFPEQPYEDVQPIQCPDIKTWQDSLLSSSQVGKPGSRTPLILDDKNRLYLCRYWDYENDLIKYINSFASQKRIQVVSGGPGTGKTFMVAKMLSNHLMHTKEKALRIVLCAPTGKAGVRLQEAVKEAKSYFKEIPDNIKKAIPDESFTIHRLLRPVPDTPYFRHNADNPLPYDVVVVDEASMVDLALMTKLMDALVPHARIIFLGDKDQLSSVEAGYVLGDICNAGRPGSVSPVSDCIVQLRKNYRQQADDYIHDAGRAVNQGDGSQAISILKSRGMFLHLPSRLHMLAYIKKRIKPWLGSFSGCTDFKAAYDNYNNFRILCPIHAGPFGLRDINEIISRIVCQEADIRPLQPWYHGLPIMVLRNDYTTGLFNGDTGIIMQAPDDKNRLMACFQGLEDDPKRFLPARLPESETAYAMTVHKSQGSEFDEVLIILPEQDVPVLTRELVYTAITRAKKKVEIIGNEEVFKKAVSRRIERSSGLRDALWG